MCRTSDGIPQAGVCKKRFRRLENLTAFERALSILLRMRSATPKKPQSTVKLRRINMPASKIPECTVSAEVFCAGSLMLHYFPFFISHFNNDGATT